MSTNREKTLMSGRLQRLILVGLCLLLSGLGLLALQQVHELDAINDQTQRDLEHLMIVPHDSPAQDYSG